MSQNNSLENSVFLVGVGHIGQALAAQWSRDIPSQLRLVAKNKEQQGVLRQKFEGAEILLPEEAISQLSTTATSSVFVLAVRPQQAIDSLAQYSAVWESSQKPLVVSLVSKMAAEELARETGGAAVIRAVPNIASAYGEGCTTMLREASLAQQDVERAATLFRHLGAVHIFDGRTAFEAASRIAGASIAFFFAASQALADNNSSATVRAALQATDITDKASFSLGEEAEAGESFSAIARTYSQKPEAFFSLLRGGLAKAGMAFGLKAPQAREIALAAQKGAAAVIKNENATMEELIAKIATPGGITEAMLQSINKTRNTPVTLNAMLTDALETGVRIAYPAFKSIRY